MNTMMFDCCRIFVTGLLLINIHSFMAPNTCGAFPVSKRLLDETIVTEYGIVPSKEYDTVNGPSSLPSAGHKCLNDTVKIFESNLRLRKRKKRIGRLKEALVYLRHYGYLGNKPLTTENVDQALRAFQRLAGIQETGRLTKLTLEKMHMARCGNVDIAHATRSKHKKRFAQVSKWANKINRGDVLRLKWYIEKYTTDIPVNDIRETVKNSFQLWTDQAPLPSMRTLKLDFTEASMADESDINILWAEGDHGDAYPFDGSGNTSNVLAHTFYPSYQDFGSLNGNIHFDDFENWVLDNRVSIDEGVYFPYVLTHEIGHALGLGHSNRQEAVMNPIYKQIPLSSLYLDVDDKCALNWNYIGASKWCLFIWLMVEYLPKFPKDNNNTLNNFNKQPPNVPAAGFPPDPYKTNRIGELTIEKKVDQMFQSLQNVDIPLCSDDNVVKFQYEELIKKKLNLPLHDAHIYSDIVCNFAAGLSDVIDKRKLLSSDNSDQQDNNIFKHNTAHDNTVGHMTAHSYPRTEQNVQDETDNVYQEVSIDAENFETKFSRENFDDDFFKKILRLLAQSR